MFYSVVSDYLSFSQDRVAAMRFCRSGLTLAISVGSMSRQSKALRKLAWIKRGSGDFSGAKEDASESQRVARLAGNLYDESSALLLEADCWQNLGNYARCISLLDRATHVMDLCGMSGGTLHAGIRNSLAEVYRCKSEYVEARNIQVHILQGISRDQSTFDYAIALHNIAQIDVETGASDDDVKCNFEGAHILFRKINFSPGLVWCDILRATLDLRRGNLSAARHLLKNCLRSAWGKDTEAVADCLEKLVSTDRWSSVHQMSLRYVVTFLVHSLKYKQRPEVHTALQFLGDFFQAQEDQETAISLFTVALDGFTQMDVHRSRAECMVRLGNISKLNGKEHKAAQLWLRARPLFERSSQGEQLADLDEKLAGLPQPAKRGSTEDPGPC
jgi:tetratricopeptide (TPR) repeat protein